MTEKTQTYGEKQGGNHGIPKWMKELKKDHGCLTGTELLPWEDHPSHADGKYYSEPYELSKKDIEELDKFCEKYNLTYIIRADFSEWYPGHTLWIEIKQKEADSDEEE
ncbi:hypothetical protein AKJ51_00315 [candidate division MSBL1 archaeon SCGC-AAA382A20]|uniref:Uncharacterized protein n=1 Tax=candidate division MSBL1 archaeon SCGC-AAA382A20 TaxID=1698280 RepID=A0A133VMM4_9EURY|nr:hypothetical protein AKJ51_00315 [candidate division MSBL1 archaeon SCGC-AAA382A20]